MPLPSYDEQLIVLASQMGVASDCVSMREYQLRAEKVPVMQSRLCALQTELHAWFVLPS